MKFIRLTTEVWVNPRLITRIEQHGASTIVYFASGRERALPTTKASSIVRMVEEGTKGID